MNRRKIERVAVTSASVIDEQIDGLKTLFPDAFSEGSIDYDKLRTALGDSADDRPERYSFMWAGKREAIQLLQTPSRATLTPAPEV